MKELSLRQIQRVAGAQVFMIANPDNIMYIITGDSKFKPEDSVTLTSSKLLMNNEECPEVFSDKGFQTASHVYKAFTIPGGTRFVKVV